MFLRFLVFMLLGYILWQWVGKKYYRAIRQWWRQPLPQKAKPSTRPVSMVRCHHCGLYIPEKEAICEDNEHFFCCEAHKRAAML